MRPNGSRLSCGLAPAALSQTKSRVTTPSLPTANSAKSPDDWAAYAAGTRVATRLVVTRPNAMTANNEGDDREYDIVVAWGIHVVPLS